MKSMLTVLTLCISVACFSQQKPAPAPLTYKSYTSFPSYPLIALDSSNINSLIVTKKKEPVVIIYFSPTCSHCQHQAEEITSHMNKFKNVQFLMVSSYNMNDIKEYVNTYGLGHFANITVANDPNFSIGQFFEIKSLPGIYVYDKNGKYKTHFETNVLADTLANAVN